MHPIQKFQSKVKILQISPSKIAFLKFLLEGYDHLASLTILDPKKGMIKISFYPLNEEFVNEILSFIFQKENF